MERAVLLGETREVKHIGVKLMSIVMSIVHPILRVMELHVENVLTI